MGAINETQPNEIGMRIGVFGGSFDPVHFGHLIMAEYCREAIGLDEIRLVPAAIPPHKQSQSRAPDDARLEMLRLAVGGHPAFNVWDFELRRGGVSYTVETMDELARERPDDELFFVMGADSLFDLPSWRDPQKICELASLVVVNRPGNSPVDFDVLRDIVAEPRRDAFARLCVQMPLIELSSTEIRRRIAARQSIRFQTPRAVEEYIRAANLYGSPAT